VAHTDWNGRLATHILLYTRFSYNENALYWQGASSGLKLASEWAVKDVVTKFRGEKRGSLPIQGRSTKK